MARPGTAWLLLALGVVGSMLASFSAWERLRSSEQVRFFTRTEAYRNSLVEELERYVRVLNAARALWAIHPPVAREEWRVFVESLTLSNSYPGLQALGFVERVAPARLPDFLAEVRQDKSQDYDPVDFQVHPQASGNERYIVKFIEPLHPNRSALGYDIGSEPNRRQAAEAARDTGQPTLSHKITLVQATHRAGVLLLLPVYSTGIQATNIALRRASLIGWVDAAFVIEDLLTRVHGLGGADVDIEIFEGTSLSPTSSLAETRRAGGRSAVGRPAAFERITSFHYGNWVWTLRFRPGAAFARNSWFSAPGFTPAATVGLSISLLVFGITRSMASTSQRAQALAEAMTARLRLQDYAMACAKNGLFILDASREDCPMIYANPAFEKMTRYSAPEPLGPDTLFLLRNTAGATEPPGMRGILEAGGAEHTVLREYRRNGSRFWAEFRLMPVLDEQGRKTHFLGIVEDVTERKRAGEQLQRAEQRYHDLLNNLPMGVCRNTPGEQGQFIEVNPAYLAMFEAVSKEELMAHRVSDLYADPAQRKVFSEKMAREGFVSNEQSELKTLRGRRFWASVTARMTTDAEGKTFFDAVVQDITDRKRVEQALVESQERFALAVQGTNDGIWDWNVITNEVYFSARWKSMLGYEEHEVENNLAGWKRLLHPEDRARALDTIHRYFSRQTDTYELEHRLRHKDGSYRWILARGVALRDAQGKPLRMAGSHVDLTARKQVEDQLRLACQKLAASQEELKGTVKQLKASHEELQQTQLQLVQAAKMESIGTLAAGVAHEVKNPLQTILIGLDYLGNTLKEPAENIASALGDMRDAVRRADSIVRELLQLSRETVFELIEDDLNRVVERCLRLLNSELLATQTNVSCHLEPNLPRVRMDPRKLEQVLLNLCINALQAMAQGGSLRVTTRSGRLSDLRVNGNIAGTFRPEEKLVVLEVQDTGPGIPQKHLARIFDPFFTTKPAGMGTGLGLSIVKKIIDLHGGAIDLRNSPQGGVVVTLALRA